MKIDQSITTNSLRKHTPRAKTEFLGRRPGVIVFVQDGDTKMGTWRPFERHFSDSVSQTPFRPATPLMLLHRMCAHQSCLESRRVLGRRWHRELCSMWRSQTDEGKSLWEQDWTEPIIA